MSELIQSFLLVVFSEMGDKTQLLALMLAVRFKKPLLVMLGILVATILNHGLATILGQWIGSIVSPENLRLGLALLFICFAIWILVPDKLDDDSQIKSYSKTNVFLATTILFFLAEMGDKTQLATIALGAKFNSPWLVTTGTTLGMLVADGLAVVFGETFLTKVPMKYVRYFSAILFAIFGVFVLLGFS
ncbi:MAG: TMEM165/GDT1 family protein [Proteobacteria bacterium]|nr:TMEM165/GDT1 family protein [Pseudomonadota bacterium]